MRISHNIAALNTHLQLGQANHANQQSMEKLSSGLRINRAGDDAAGLAISEKMRGQIRGLEQAERNSQDGISMIQTAEGALNETHSILQRMRELSVQASNDTNTADDRGEIQKEMNQLTEEIDRISTSTEFNTKKLLNGDSGLSVDDGSVVGNAQSSSETKTGTYDVDIGSLATSASDVTAGSASATDAVNDSGKITINGTDVNINSSDTVQDAMDKINTISGVEAKINDSDNFEIATTDVGSDATLDISADKDNIITGNDTWNGSATSDTGNNASVSTLDDPDGTDLTGDMVVDGNQVTLNTGDGKGLSFKALSDESTTIDVGGALSFQIGSNKGQQMSVNLNDMGSSSLGVSNIDVTSQKGASDAVEQLDNAIQTVSQERSKMGAYQNRLEHTINNLGTSAENLTASESRIRDVDYASAA